MSCLAGVALGCGTHWTPLRDLQQYGASQLTSIDSSTGPKRRRPNGASSGYREQPQYARKEKERKLGSEVSSRKCMQNDMSRQTSMSARLPCLQQESRTKRGEARLRWGRLSVLRLTCAKQHSPTPTSLNTHVEFPTAVSIRQASLRQVSTRWKTATTRGHRFWKDVV